MPINFDERRDAEDRDIVIRGETFTVQYVSPQTMDRFEEIQTAATERKGSITWGELADSFSERIALMIDDGNGSLDRWKELVAGGQVAYAELREICNLVVEMATDFPTMPPSGSTAGGAKPVTSSPAGSS